MPRGGTPPLVPMWPGVRLVEQNPFPFFPFHPGWRRRFSASDFHAFCTLLRLAWVSPRPCFLPSHRPELELLLGRKVRLPLSERVLSFFVVHERTGLLYFPPQLRALERLVKGEDLYSLLWDESL